MPSLQFRAGFPANIVVILQFRRAFNLLAVKLLPVQPGKHQKLSFRLIRSTGGLLHRHQQSVAAQAAKASLRQAASRPLAAVQTVKVAASRVQKQIAQALQMHIAVSVTKQALGPAAELARLQIKQLALRAPVQLQAQGGHAPVGEDGASLALLVHIHINPRQNFILRYKTASTKRHCHSSSFILLLILK